MHFPEIEWNQEIESIVEAFESQWTPQTDPRDVLQFLPEGPQFRETVFEELASTDMELRFAAGQEVDVESYIRLQDTVTYGEQWLIEMLTNEYELKSRLRGESPDLSEYETRFPDRFPALVARIGNDRSAYPAPPSDRTTDRQERFQKKQLHKTGGLGAVWLAYDRELDRLVALKEIRQDYVTEPAVRMRFEREAQITSRLDHPGILPVYGIGETHDGRPFYAMKFVEGETLSQKINAFYSGDPPGDSATRDSEFVQLLRHFVDVCNTLQFAHEIGVVHRDIKPHNIMVGKHGQTLVVDWGLAKVTNKQFWQSPEDPSNAAGNNRFTLQTQEDEPQSRIESLQEIDATLFGSRIGTTGYMSPEQAAGRNDELDARSDVYSVGALLDDVLGERMESPTHSPRSKQVLKSIVAKAMSDSPENRYANTAAVAADIEKYLAYQKTDAHPENIAERSLRMASRHRTWLTSITAVTVCVALVAFVAIKLIRLDRITTEAKYENTVEVLTRLFEDSDAPQTPSTVEAMERVPGLKPQIARLPRKHQALINHAITNGYLTTGKYDEALSLAREVQSIVEDLPTVDPDFRVRNLLRISDTYSRAGYQQDALNEVLKAQHLAKQELGEESNGYLNCIWQLNTVYRKLQKLELAKESGRNLNRLASKIATNDEDGLFVLSSMVALKHDARQLNMEQWKEKATKKGVEPDAFDVASSIEERLKQFEDVGDWVVTTVDFNRGLEHLQKREFASARKEFQDVLDRRVQIVKHEHPDVHQVIDAMCFFQIFEMSECYKNFRVFSAECDAVDWIQEMMEKYRAWGDDSPGTYRWIHWLAYAHFNKFELEKKQLHLQAAIDLLDSAIARCKKSKVGPKSFAVAELMALRARFEHYVRGPDSVKNAIRMLKETENLYDELRDRQKTDLYNKGHLQLLISTAKNLAVDKQQASADQYFTKAYEIRQRMSGENHSETVKLRRDMARFGCRLKSLSSESE